MTTREVSASVVAGLVHCVLGCAAAGTGVALLLIVVVRALG